MDLEAMREAVAKQRIRWAAHALERMVSRGISTSDVRHVLLGGHVVEDHPDDRPYPSALMLDHPPFRGGRPLHVVVAFSHESRYAYVVTAYEPDTDHFGPDFRTRRGDA